MVVVVIEGVDGAGKSTLIRLLSEKLSDLNFVYIQTSNRDDMVPAVKRFLNENLQDNIMTRFMYFSFANVLASKEAKEHIRSGKDVLIDRFVYSTLAYHKVLDTHFGGNNLANIEYLSSEFEKALIKPDLVFFLYVAEKERLRRVLRRDSSENNKLDTESTLQINLENEFRNIAARLRKEGLVTVYEIDTTEMSAYEVANLAEKAIREFVSKKHNSVMVRN